MTNLKDADLRVELFPTRPEAGDALVMVFDSFSFLYAGLPRITPDSENAYK